MGRMKKEFDKDGIFQQRFREQYGKLNITQQAFADALGVSRPTVMGWLDGKNIPDIISLKRMTELFNVSADYLLGISDTERPDVNLRAAVEYTGLSEKAVERIHNGFDGSGCDEDELSDEEKNKNRNMASFLIVSENFIRMVNGIRDVSVKTYWERIFYILSERYLDEKEPEYDEELEEREESEYGEEAEEADFYFANDKDREICKIALSLFFKSDMVPEEPNQMPEEIESMTDDEVHNSVFNIYSEYIDKSALHQFLASKAFTNFIDQLIEKKNKDAEKNIKYLEDKVLTSKPVQNKTH